MDRGILRCGKASENCHSEDRLGQHVDRVQVVDVLKFDEASQMNCMRDIQDERGSERTDIPGATIVLYMSETIR